MDREERFPDFSRGEQKSEKRLWLLRTVTENTISLTNSVVWKYRYSHRLEPSVPPLIPLFFFIYIFKIMLYYYATFVQFPGIAELLLIFSFN